MSMNETNGAHTSADPRDGAGQSEFPAGKPVERDLGADPSRTTSDAEIAPDGAKIPSRAPVLALSTSDPAFSPANPITVNGYLFEPASRQADLVFKLSVTEAEVSAVKLVNAHLERRAQAFDEEVDVTKPRDVRQDALLAMNVLDRFADDQGPLTRQDAGRMVGTVRRLLADRDGIAVLRKIEFDQALPVEAAQDVIIAVNVLSRFANGDHALTPEDARRAISSIRGLRDDAIVDEERIGELEAKLTAAEGKIEDLTVERDAAAENARRERGRRGTYNDDDLQTGAERMRRDILTLGGDDLHSIGPDGQRKRVAVVEATLRSIGLRTEREERPRCRVVTSPRFYSNEQREEAISAISRVPMSWPGGAGTVRSYLGRIVVGQMLDAGAQALGMRRAAA